jgi:hypothetical protein
MIVATKARLRAVCGRRSKIKYCPRGEDRAPARKLRSAGSV